MTKTIIFDMDGTIADLYSVENWCAKLDAFDETPYIEAAPMWDMTALANVLNALKKFGWTVSIVTWRAINENADYAKRVREAKKQWLIENGFPFDEFHCVKYGTPKAKYAGKGYNVLVDDNENVRDSFHKGATINPVELDLIEILPRLAFWN